MWFVLQLKHFSQLLGTAAMAPYLHNGVVDSNFNVYGTHNLLVVC